MPLPTAFVGFAVHFLGIPALRAALWPARRVASDTAAVSCSPVSTNPRGDSHSRSTIAVGAEHRGTLMCQRLGPRAADAASHSRNQRHFVPSWEGSGWRVVSNFATWRLACINIR
jgi:hypothetical protein